MGMRKVCTAYEATAQYSHASSELRLGFELPVTEFSVTKMFKICYVRTVQYECTI
jgi:hypothetical protein